MGVEWADRTEFAEAAEALGIETDRVLAMLGDRFVLYTDERDMALWSAVMVRDRDGILKVMSQREQKGMYDEFKKRLEEL